MQHIAHIADRADLAAPGTQLLPQGLDVHIHGAGLSLEFRAPDEAHDALPGQDHLGVDHQVAQKLILLEGQLHGFSVGQHDVTVVVQLDLAHRQLLAALLPGPAKEGLHPAEELHHGERLLDIVVGPVVQALDHVHLRGLGGDHDHRQPLGYGVGPEAADNVAAVFVRQHHVQQHQIRQQDLQGPVKVRSPGKVLDHIIAVFQGDGLDLPNVIVIFNDVNQCH